MSTKDFLKRRLIRLHPMVCMGALIGLLLCLADSNKYFSYSLTRFFCFVQIVLY